MFRILAGVSAGLTAIALLVSASQSLAHNPPEPAETPITIVDE